MPNAIKYSTSAQTLALKKGNFWIGTGDVGKGPTSTTDYWNGITPPSGGYTIYLNKASNGPSIYTAANGSQLISLTNQISGSAYTTVAQCLDWFAGQTDKMCFNRDYEAIVTNGLVLNVDAGFTPSYPTTGTTWYDLSSSGSNGTLTNGPTFNSGNGGSIVFDGVDDYIRVTNREDLDFPTANFTAGCWFKSTQSKTYVGLLGKINFSVGTAGWTLEFSDAKVTCWTNSFLVQSPLTYNDGNWHYGLMTMGTPNTGQINVYVDGYSVTTVQMPSYTFDPTNLDLWIGGWTDGTSYLFNGNIAIAHIYNRVLSAAEVLQNYNAQKGRFGL